jgi:hypothetical protein
MTPDELQSLIDKIRLLRAKANDPSVTLEEAKAFAAKAQELVHANRIDPSLIDPAPTPDQAYGSGSATVPTAPVAHPPAPAAPRRWGLGLLETALLVGILAVATVGAFVLLQPRPNRAATVPATIASPTVAPTLTPATRVTQALWSRIGRLGPSYHLSGSGRTRTTETNQKFTLELDVVADDFSGRIDSTGADAWGKALLVRYDGVVYVRPSGEKKWANLKTNDPQVRQWPFMGIQEPREIRYVESLEEDGTTLHRFETTQYYRPSVPRMLELTSFDVALNSVRLVLVVDDDGVPVRADLRVEGGGLNDDDKPRVVGTAKYTFTEWDGNLTITLPK